MKAVRVFASPQTLRVLAGSILSRKDLSVSTQESLRGCAQVLLKHPTDLAVFEEDGTGTLWWVLTDLTTRFLHAPFQVFALNVTSGGERGLPRIVSKTFAPGWTVADFNSTVAASLGLPTRKCARVPVRLGLRLSDKDPGFIANTVNVSNSGLLVQSVRPLIAGKVYGLRFVGQGKTASAQFSARALREDENSGPGLSTRNYVLEWVDVTPGAMEAFLADFIPDDSLGDS